MKIDVKTSTIVRPAHETPNHRIWLSNIDLFLSRTHLPSIYLYKQDGSSNFFDTRILKEALSKVLVAFYPVAGRLGRDKKGRIELICNGEGVLFSEAETESAMDELGDFIPIEIIMQLVPKIDPSSDISSYPVFLVQVTKFSCGSVCLGIGFHHTVGDGTAALHFINTWSDVARGLTVAIPPFMDRTLLRSRDPPSPKFHHIEYDPPPVLNNPKENSQSLSTVSNDDCNKKSDSVAILSITLDQLETLRAKSISNDSQERYTMYEILTAHIWRCACKARGLSNDQESKLYISIDGRSRFNPPLPPGYFGNVIFFATPIALSGELLSEQLAQTVKRIREEIKRRDDEYLRSAIDYLELVEELEGIMQSPKTSVSPNLKIISWTRLPFRDADFGWGRPLNIRASKPFEGKGHILPSQVEDGSLSLIISFETHHMEQFQKLFYDF